MPTLPGDVQWFPAEIRRLIVAIKKHEGLHNPRHESYGLRDAQTKAWKWVAALVGGGKTDTQCRDKWNCLRGTYRRHVRTEAMNNVKRRSGWPWADMMTFIKPYILDRDDLLEIQTSRKGAQIPPTGKPKTAQTVVIKQAMGNVLPQTHSPHCPVSNLTAVSIGNTKGTQGSGALTFAGGLYPGGIIFNTNRVGLGIVQPNQSNVVGIVQPNQAVSIVQPNQTPVSMAFVQTSKASSSTSNSSPSTGTSKKNINDSTVSTSVKSTPGKPPFDPFQTVDVEKIKSEPDNPNSPDKTEFVDMEVAVKREPMEEEEEEEIDLPVEFNFLPEDSSQGNSQESDQPNKDSGRKSPDKNLSDQSEDNGDSNELFMRSTVSHMRKLSAYEQSVFKLKVQQLLHEMMFPQQP